MSGRKICREFYLVPKVYDGNKCLSVAKVINPEVTDQQSQNQSQSYVCDYAICDHVLVAACVNRKSVTKSLFRPIGLSLCNYFL